MSVRMCTQWRGCRSMLCGTRQYFFAVVEKYTSFACFEIRSARGSAGVAERLCSGLQAATAGGAQRPKQCRLEFIRYEPSAW